MQRNNPRHQGKPGGSHFPRLLPPVPTRSCQDIPRLSMPAICPYLGYPVALLCRVPPRASENRATKILLLRLLEKPATKAMRICAIFSGFLKKSNKDYCLRPVIHQRMLKMIPVVRTATEKTAVTSTSMAKSTRMMCPLVRWTAHQFLVRLPSRLGEVSYSPNLLETFADALT